MVCWQGGAGGAKGSFRTIKMGKSGHSMSTREIVTLTLACWFCFSSSPAQASPDKPQVTCPDGSTASKPKECTLEPSANRSTLTSGSSDGVAPYVEYRKHIEAAQNLSPLDQTLFGDSVSLYNGNTVFSVTDIDIPGNNSLPVKLTRNHAVELQPQGNLFPYDTRLRSIDNWEVDVPYMAATYPASTGWPSQRCSGGLIPSIGGLFFRHEVWQGVSIHIPGESDRTLLGIQTQNPKPSTAGPWRATTSQRDMFDCLSSVTGLTGEGFRMTTSSGVKYYFDVATTRTASTLEKWTKDADGLPEQHFQSRSRIYLLASKIEDRFGNSVSITYNASGHPTLISANDGRAISLTYSGGRLASASSHGRTWQYQYTGNNLSSVVQPDGSKWQYTYANDLMPFTDPYGISGLPYCGSWPTLLSASYTLTITHPSGAVGQFNLTNTRHTRSGVHAGECIQTGYPENPTYEVLVPYYFDVMSLTSRTITGPGLSSMTWSYDYGPADQTWWGTWGTSWTYPCTTCKSDKTVVVTQPDGSKLKHKFGILYTVNDGRALGVETLTPTNSLLRSEVSDYLSEASAPSQAFYGSYGSVLDMSDPSIARVRPIVKRTITQQGRKFIWEVGTGCNGTYCFDTYAQPLKVVKSSSSAP